MFGLCCHVCGPTLCTFSFTWLVDWLVRANLWVCMMPYMSMFLPKFQKWRIVRGLDLSLPKKLNFHSPNLAPASSVRSPLPIHPRLRRRPLLTAAKKPTFLPARMILPAGRGCVAGALRAADVDPMKELFYKDVVAADSQPQLVQHSTNDDESVSVCRY